MKQGEIAARLILIEEWLTRIESLIASSMPAEKIAQAMADIEQSYGLAGQLVEVAHIHREQIEALIHRLDTLVRALTEHDSRLISIDSQRQAETGEIRELMVQLRELARSQVRSQANLARALGEGDGWDGAERRNSILDRRGQR